MKFSYTLLKQFVPKLPPKNKIADFLSTRVFEVEDVIENTVDIKLPSNRYGDASSHLGIAREMGAALGVSPRMPTLKPRKLPVRKGLIQLQNQASSSLLRYSAVVLDVSALKPLPRSFDLSLHESGIRSIHPIVDAMNYVMIEVGQPLHAFDFEKVAPKDSKGSRMRQIVVRFAKREEALRTLDGQTLKLHPDDLVIADNQSALALAGIKGGESSGVDGTTSCIILEAANFSSLSVYATSQRHRLVTDASVRFGHGLSPSLVDMGILRALEILLSLGAKVLDSAEYYPKPPKGTVIDFDPARYEKLIGLPVELGRAKKHLDLLGFTSKKQGNALRVSVPPWRMDIDIPEDLIEEVARVEGFERVPASPPLIHIREASEDLEVRVKEAARSFLQDVGMDEIYTHSFVPQESVDGEFLELQNPISKEYAVLRPSLTYRLEGALRSNIRFEDVVRVFELGHVFGVQKGKAKEGLHLGAAIASRDPKSFLELKGIAQDLLERCLAFSDVYFKTTSHGLEVRAGEEILGVLRHEAFKTFHFSFLELNLDRATLLSEEERNFKPLPKYPGSMRDVSFLVDRSHSIGSLMQAMQEVNSSLIQDIDLIDEYIDEERLSGMQSLTFRIFFQSESRTLTDAEVDQELSRIVSRVTQVFGASVK